MNFYIIGRTTEITASNIIERGINESIKTFSGSNAGVCYMSNCYFNESVSGEENAIKRFNHTMKSGHHSVADHYNVTILMEDIPKILAMILNSTQTYATSEKSARYTVMENLTEEESKIVDKWNTILGKVLINNHGLSEENATKIARENSRYFISIFSPATTMSHTKTVREWNYLYQWMNKLLNRMKKYNEQDGILHTFSKNMIPWVEKYCDWFQNSDIYIEDMIDPNDRFLEFLPQIEMGSLKNKMYTQSILKDSYSVMYHASFAALAQLQRHRSIKYVINDMSTLENPVFFVPEFIAKDDELVHEWREDMYSLRERIPQGLVVEVAELGTIDKFLLKCNERLCGRAQYETMSLVRDMLDGFIKYGEFSHYYNEEIRKRYTPGVENIIMPKCAVRGTGCTDKGGCISGANSALYRLF